MHVLDTSSSIADIVAVHHIICLVNKDDYHLKSND